MARADQNWGKTVNSQDISWLSIFSHQTSEYMSNPATCSPCIRLSLSLQPGLGRSGQVVPSGRWRGSPRGKDTDFIYFFPFIFISWRLITLQYCSGFCHTLTWISHGFTCVSHPDPPSHLPPHPIPLSLPSAPALSTCLMHPTWAGDPFHPW